MFKNPKTTLAGIGAILTAIGLVINGLANGTPIEWGVVITSFITGIGLILAKDWNISGLLGKKKEE